MKVIEKSITGKAGAERCEDGIAVGNDFVAVVDGSTSKSHVAFHPEMSNGRYCMTLVVECIKALAADADCRLFCQQATDIVRAAYGRSEELMDRLAHHPTERMAASAAIYSQARQEVWLVGDCQCLVDGQLYENPKPYEELIAEMRSAFIRLQLKQGRALADFQEHDDGRDFILPVLIDSCQYQNQTFAVIDGFNIPIDKVLIIDVSQANEIVLATDGYPFLLPTWSESEEALARQLRDDPLCIGRYKATKGMMKGLCSFDDRSYIRLQLRS